MPSAVRFKGHDVATMLQSNYQYDVRVAFLGRIRKISEKECPFGRSAVGVLTWDSRSGGVGSFLVLGSFYAR